MTYDQAKRRAQRQLIVRKRAIRLFEMIAAAIVAVAIIVHIGPARSAEAIYEDTPPSIEKYVQPNLRNADGSLTNSSCCGRSDAYWADEFERDEEGNLVAIITDPRDDNLFRGEGKAGSPREHLPIGTRVVIPNNKVIRFPEQPPNRTGHGWVWVSVYEDDVTGERTPGNVICYVYPEAS